MEHSEMPGTDGKSIGIQMWVNLPRELKKIEPGYQQVNADEFPDTTIEGGVVREIVGHNSPLELKTDVLYEEVKLNASGQYNKQLPKDMRGFVYLVAGSANVNDKPIDSGDAVFMDSINSISIESTTDSHLMVCFGKPHGEPIYQHGPFVD
jgi:redox-sensitive bicupin YhaK (pirin superfamily)